MAVTINGDGTITLPANGTLNMGGGSSSITNLAVGGLPDGTVDNDTLANTTITNAKINGSAAIAKSKLASLDLVNADINASAAIAKSKLEAGITKWVRTEGTASGRAVQWTGLPSGIQELNVTYYNVSPAATSHLFFQLGSGSTTWLDGSGDYKMNEWWIAGANQSFSAATSRCNLNRSHDNAASTNSGVVRAIHHGGNKWSLSTTQTTGQQDAEQGSVGFGLLSAELTAVRLYLENDTTFDSGEYYLNYLI